LRREEDDGESIAAVDQAVRLSASSLPASECLARLGEGWVAEEALAVALFCALRAESFEHGVVLAVNITGDSDSTGSLAGNILGAALGEQSIPRRWLEVLELREASLRWQ
jgi:ADP-ribosylglycohydrolase